MYCSFFMKPARRVLQEGPVSADGLVGLGFGQRLSFFYTPFDSAGLVSPWGIRHRESFREMWDSSPHLDPLPPQTVFIPEKGGQARNEFIPEYDLVFSLSPEFLITSRQ
jgi:hypothetical protein